MSDRREDLAAMHAHRRRLARGTMEKFGTKPPMPDDYAAADLTMTREDTLAQQVEYWKTDAHQMRANWEHAIADIPEIERAAASTAWMRAIEHVEAILGADMKRAAMKDNPYEELT